MRIFAVAIVLASLIFVSKASEDPTGKLAGVSDLTPSTFNKVIDGSKAALIEFYAPWCGHCKRLTPEYKKLGEAIATNPKLNSRVVIAKVDADQHRELGERFQVQGFPTIKWFPKGRPGSPEDYQGARTSDAMLSWIEKKLESDATFAFIPELAAIAVQLMDGSMDAEEALTQAKETVETVEESMKENAELYVKFIQRAADKGKEWITNEIARLQKMADGGKMSPVKLLEVNRKLSVLESFSQEDTEAPDGAEEEDVLGDAPDMDDYFDDE